MFYVRNPKPNRLTIACHESGHAVVMAATYGSIGSAKIDLKNHPNGFLGMVTPVVYEPQDKGGQLIRQESSSLCAPAVIREILISSGGFCGESFCGKQEGSNHEKFLTYFRCRILDEAVKVPPLTNWNYFVNWAKQIILNNRTLFWEVVDDLLKNGELTNGIKNILHQKVKKESPHKFF